MKKIILGALTGLLLASAGAMAATPTQYSASASGRDTGPNAPSFFQVNPTGGN